MVLKYRIISKWLNKMKLKKALAVAVGMAILLLSGCLPAPTNSNKSNVIATSFYPVYIFTLNLTNGIEDLSVECMAENNVGCLHDYTLTAKDAKLLNDADVLVINGAGMEGFVHDLGETTENICIVDSSQGIELLCDADDHSADATEHGEEHSHNHEHGENSHIWMSVDNAEKQVVNIVEGLVKVYPEHEKAIFANCDLYIARLRDLKDDMESVSLQVQDKPVISFHNAYDYMAQEMGFHIVTTIESDHGGEPSAKKLAGLSVTIKEQGVKALFTEPHYEGSAATILSAETGIGVYTLNPVLNGEDTKTAYEDIMRENFDIILKAVK